MTALDVVGALARRQIGVVSRAQLLRAGLTADAIKHLIATGRLVAIDRGVYAVGHDAVSDRGRIVAALLATGPKAIASHRTAAFLSALTPSLPAVLHVTIPGRADALAKRLIHPDDLAKGTDPTRSGLETRLLTLIRQAGLPEPLVNHRIGPYLVDFAWPEQKVIVETDGYATHGHRAAFERDRARDTALQAAGYVVLRFTHRQITRAPLTVIAQLAAVVLSR